MNIPWLDSDTVSFPPPNQALAEPNGLLAAGGGLSVEWLTTAYRQGIFPWYEAGQPILWWSPDPRLILTPDAFRISRSLNKLLKKHEYMVSFDTSFSQVVHRCGAIGRGEAETWITSDMVLAYTNMHKSGLAHSVEIWSNDSLVGGLYGVALGKVFFGESMFSLEDNTSKLALCYLTRHLKEWGFELIDCQVSSEHLITLGAINISREEYNCKLAELTSTKDRIGKWEINFDLFTNANEYKL